MSYVALYRKYRPQNFSDMIGQEHITKILKNQIVSSKISHAYIFSGTRGTGKTTAAKVFARAVNCLNNQDGEPCNECEACRSILEGNTTDVVEMDAASNNSVENIRSIRQEVAYSTTGLKYKVYIIDEAHMLSTSAFNALLKTLEEPPENVIFILATTEEHKILPTILSRCIRFEFKKIGKAGIVQRLEHVLKDYDVHYDIEALEHIAELADGGMRDALSILERCITSGEGEITEQKIEEIIGTVPKKLIQDIVINVLEYNITRVDELVNTILSSGKDLRNISASITQEFLKVLIAVSCGDNVDMLEELKQACGNISVARIHEIIKHMSKLDDDLRQSNNVAMLFKAKLLELSTKVVVLDESELLAKIKELEMKIEKLEMTGVKVQAEPKAKAEKKEKQAETAPKEEVTEQVQTVEKPKEAKVAEVKLGRKKVKELDKIMKKAVDSDNLKLYSALAGAQAFEEEETIVFATCNAFAYGVLSKDNTREDLRKIVNEEMNNDFNVRIEYIKETKKDDACGFENMMKDSGIPFEVVD